MLNLNPQIFLQVLGIVFIGIGLAARLGLWKKWYWKSSGTVYSYIPLGLMFILFSLETMAKERLASYIWLFWAFFVVLIALGIWWVMRTPAFIKPTWVRRVEKHPRNALKAMQEAVEDDPDWEQHVVSEEAIIAWIKTLEVKKPKPKGNTKAKK